MLDKLNQMVKKLDVFDIGLVKFTVLFVTIIIVKLFPQILMIRIRYLLVLAIICAIRPMYRFWFSK